jgi:hypothetical protein
MSKKGGNKASLNDMPALPQRKQENQGTIQIGAHFLKVKEDKRSKKKKVAEAAKQPQIAAQPQGSKITSKNALIKSGRHFCGCEGELHEVLTNCLNCGKIVCEQERLGPCLFCGHDVHMFDMLTKKHKEDAEFLKAWEHRNRLLEFDRTFEERTIVIDDQIDFDESSSNMWLSEAEKLERKKKEERLKELSEDSRKKLTYTFDFAVRRVLVDTTKLMRKCKRSSKICKRMQISLKKKKKYSVPMFIQVCFRVRLNLYLLPLERRRI